MTKIYPYLEQELELLRAMYGEDLHESPTQISLAITPYTQFTGTDFVGVTIAVNKTTFEVHLNQQTGLDYFYWKQLHKSISQEIPSILEESPNSIIFSILQFAQEKLTDINDYNNECMVCLDLLEADQSLLCTIPGCQHSYHKSCLKAWWSGQRRKLQCPLCRGDVERAIANAITA